MFAKGGADPSTLPDTPNLFRKASSAVSVMPALLVDFIAGAGVAALLFALDPDGPSLGPLAVLALWWGACATLWSGTAMLSLLGAREQAASPLFALIAGAALTAHALLVAIKIVGVPAGMGFVAWGGVATVAGLFLRIRETRRVAATRDLGLFLLCCAVAFAWGWRSSHLVETMRATGRLMAWTDYFIHAGEIASFMHSPAFGRGPISLVDSPSYLYHFASYTFPAAIADLTGATPLAASLSSWLGLSFFLMLVGTAVLSTVLAGFPAAVVGIALVAAAPDASLYGLKNGFLGFHWLLVTSPGSGYAIGTAMAGLALLVLWIRERKAGLLVSSAILVAATFMFRAHIFALIAPSWAAIVLLAWSAARRVLATSALFVAAIAVLFVPLLLVGCTGCERFTYDLALDRYFQLINSNSAILTHPGWLQKLSELPVGGILLLLVAAFGVPLAVYMAYLLTLILRRRCDVVALIPALLTMTFVGVTIFAPVPWGGDVGELKQRGFVLVYAVLAVWTALALTGLTRQLRVSRALAGPLLGLVAVAAVAGPAWFSETLAGPHLAWAGAFYGGPVDLNLVSVADYLRQEQHLGDVFSTDRADPAAILTDDATRVTSLTGMPAFVSRAGILSAHNPIYARIVKERLEALASLDGEKDMTAATAQLRRLGIRWYLVGKGASPPGTPKGAQPRSTQVLGSSIDPADQQIFMPSVSNRTSISSRCGARAAQVDRRTGDDVPDIHPCARPLARLSL